MLFETLSYVGNELNKENILWGIGASILLNSYGMVKEPHDIDILVAVKDIERADNLLKALGVKKIWEKSETYATKYFYEYVVNEIDLDVMCGLTLNFHGGSYEHEFDESSVTDIRIINGVEIPFTSLEDWYVIYSLIPGRGRQVDMIETYLNEKGVKHRELLERALTKNLPGDLTGRLEGLLTR